MQRSGKGPKPRLGYTPKTLSKELVTWDGTMWTGRIYVGSQSQPMDVIFDNGSDWLTLQSKECQFCQGNRFDPERSSTGVRIS